MDTPRIEQAAERVVRRARAHDPLRTLQALQQLSSEVSDMDGRAGLLDERTTASIARALDAAGSSVPTENTPGGRFVIQEVQFLRSRIDRLRRP